MVTLTADLIESFSGAFLSPLYDEAKPTPQMHRDGWALYSSDAPLAAIAAPREHAKSTAFTHDYILAVLMWRAANYIIVVSANEEMAIEHLGDISKELHENEDLIREFGVRRFITDAKTDIIVEFDDGHQARIIAKGSGQKMRGRKWNGKRPGLIVCDDLEDDEQVESEDRRLKFQRWFFRALKPALRDGGKIRVHGTILHEDSLLARLMKAGTWSTLFYRAHASFDDFTNILWPEKFPEARLRGIQLGFVEQLDAAGYSQEYLNDPFDNSDAYLRLDDFIPMTLADIEIPKKVYVGCDFAVSTKGRANRTSFTVGGVDPQNLLHIVDQRVGRWDTQEWIDELFEIEARHHPEIFFVEDGVIWKAIAPMIYREMQAKGIWLNCFPLMPIRDKATRGRPFQKRSRAGAMRFNKDTSWYPGYESELRRFTGRSDATLDDQFDSTATLALGLEGLSQVEEEDFESDDSWEMRRASPIRHTGRSAVTGY